jgi:hypothetical protein
MSSRRMERSESEVICTRAALIYPFTVIPAKAGIYVLDLPGSRYRIKSGTGSCRDDEKSINHRFC